ncbi:MAG: hypothetical protein ACRC6X_00110, partial [Culicoidibacterales bacterium]
EVLVFLDIGIKIYGGVVAAILAPVTGGASLVVYGGMLLGRLAAEAFLNNGRNLITGEKMKSGDYLLGVLEAVLNIIPGLGMLDDIVHATRLIKLTANVSKTIGKVVNQAIKVGKPLLGGLAKAADFLKKYKTLVSIGSGAIAGGLNDEGIESIILGAVVGGALSVLFNLFGKGLKDGIHAIFKKLKVNEIGLEKLLKGVKNNQIPLSKYQVKIIHRDYDIKVDRNGVSKLIMKPDRSIVDNMEKIVVSLNEPLDKKLDDMLPGKNIRDIIIDKHLSPIKKKTDEAIKKEIENIRKNNQTQNINDLKANQSAYLISNSVEDDIQDKLKVALGKLSELKIDEGQVNIGMLQAL